MNSIGPFNPKNYQIWYYRRELLERHNDPSVELQFVERMLEDDSKNIHAWGYRQWVIQRFGLWSAELKYSESLIEQDVKNNSAWTERYFVMANTSNLKDTAVLEQEISYTCDRIRLNTQNESPWSYLRGLFQDDPADKKRPATDFPQLKQFAFEIFALKPKCRFALQFLVFFYEQEQKHELTELAVLALKRLDVIRAKYWAFRLRTLRRGNWQRDDIDRKHVRLLLSENSAQPTLLNFYRSKYS